MFFIRVALSGYEFVGLRGEIPYDAEEMRPQGYPESTQTIRKNSWSMPSSVLKCQFRSAGVQFGAEIWAIARAEKNNKDTSCTVTRPRDMS